MKTKILLLTGLIFLAIACTDETPIENETIIDAQSVLEIVNAGDGNGQTIAVTEEEFLEIEKEFIQNRAFSDQPCGGHGFTRVYWIGAAREDFELREDVRTKFRNDHSLDLIFRADDSVDRNYEGWKFDFDGRNEIASCPDPGVKEIINNNGGGQVSTDGD